MTDIKPAETEAVAEVKPVLKPKFSQRDFGVSSFKRNEWHLTLQEAQTMDDVSNPRLWSDILGKQARGDTVEAFKPDTSEYAKFVVVEVGTSFIRLGKIEGFTPVAVTIADASPLQTKWNVGKRAHDVVRKADNQVMAGGFQTKDQAVAWIDDHMKKMAA